MTSSNHQNIQNCTNSLFLRKPLIFRWMILRTESIVLPPFFYILAAEKEKLNTFWRNCTGKNNPVHPLVVWINININSVESAVFRPHLILSQTEGFCKKISQFLCAANYCGNLRGALKLDLSKNLVFCPNQVDPHPPPRKLGHPKLKKKLMFFLHFRLF